MCKMHTSLVRIGWFRLHRRGLCIECTASLRASQLQPHNRKIFKVKDRNNAKSVQQLPRRCNNHNSDNLVFYQ
jgi:hypothetical protein